MSMAQRSDFPRRDDDFYPTPEAAVLPLLPHIPDHTTFHEPCAGAADLVGHLERHGVRCVAQSDINPRASTVLFVAALRIPFCDGDMFITNPPYKWKDLAPIMSHLYHIATTWLLLPAAMAHNQRMGPHMKKCLKIVSIGRVQWFEGTPGTLDYAWYLFDANHNGPTEFYGRGQDYITKNDQA